MAGTVPGPMAKPDDVRQRRNEPAVEQRKVGGEDGATVPSYVELSPTPPPAGEQWHPHVVSWWEALIRDPARMTMSTADWASAHIMAESISRDLKPQVVGTIPGIINPETGEVIPGELKYDVVPINGARMGAFLKFLALLGVTEGARRAMGMHVQFGVNIDGPAPEGVATGNRASLFAVPDPNEQV